MKRTIIFLLVLLCSQMLCYNQSIIKVNQVGYISGHPKYGWVNDVKSDIIKWTVRRSVNDEIICSGTQETSKKYDAASGETVTRIDFSTVDNPGTYYLDVENIGSSFEFRIAPNVYKEVWSAGIKSYYYQRSGIELNPEFAGIWSRKASHTSDGIIYEGYTSGKIIGGEYRKSDGGWYDAGDFGKKIVPASMALYSFMSLAELYPLKVINATIDIPNPWNGLPDMLAEAKWELDWFFTMQENNGGVHHLIVSPDFFLGLAQSDTLPRYITGVTSTATADFAASMAMASRVYKLYLPEYADSCLVAARKAWNFLINNPEIYPKGGYVDPEGVNNTGAYTDSNDRDERLWAAAELFRTTGEPQFSNFFTDNYSHFRYDFCAGWNATQNYALYSWLLADQPSKDPELEDILRIQIKIFADSIRQYIESNGYGSALAAQQYNWGSNSHILNYGMELIIINNILDTQEYTGAALHQLNYILGCNPLNLCFVGGFGTNGVKDPHQSINSYDNLTIAPPGFVPGGANFMKQDRFLTRLIENSNPAPAKCYVDHHWSYASNEVCMSYNSGLVFLAGFFMENGKDYVP